MNAECMACDLGVTVGDLCALTPWYHGCAVPSEAPTEGSPLPSPSFAPTRFMSTACCQDRDEAVCVACLLGTSLTDICTIFNGGELRGCCNVTMNRAECNSMFVYGCFWDTMKGRCDFLDTDPRFILSVITKASFVNTLYCSNSEEVCAPTDPVNIKHCSDVTREKFVLGLMNAIAICESPEMGCQSVENTHIFLDHYVCKEKPCPQIEEEHCASVTDVDGVPRCKAIYKENGNYKRCKQSGA